MVKITGERASGKTSAIVAFFMTDPKGLLVVPSYATLHYVLDRWPKLRTMHVTTREHLEITASGRDYSLYLDEVAALEVPESLRSRIIAAAGPA